ncbi:MAG TPA: hypothetical protein VMJ34_13105 [Bryobacteraceae bacterium]|nr:hypothetical protein [Bryobacteraceae bacterium]
MTARTTRAATVALCVIAACVSCQRKKPPVPVMVPPPVTVQLPPQQTPPPPPPELPPPKADTTTPPPQVASGAEVPGPPKKKLWRPRKTHKKEDEAAQTAEAQPPDTDNPDTAAAPMPQLGQMLTDRQRREYESHINDSLGRARANLARARKQPDLTDAQQRIAAQVETFIQQAMERRKTDLVSSRSLAERADLLSRDLMESLH